MMESVILIYIPSRSSFLLGKTSTIFAVKSVSIAVDEIQRDIYIGPVISRSLLSTGVSKVIISFLVCSGSSSVQPIKSFLPCWLKGPGSITISTAELSSNKTAIINDNLIVFKRLGRVTEVINTTMGDNGVKIIVGGETLILYFDQNFNLSEQKAKIAKKAKEIDEKIHMTSLKLKNKSFLRDNIFNYEA